MIQLFNPYIDDFFEFSALKTRQNPFDGIIRIRFNGYNLSLFFKAPLFVDAQRYKFFYLYVPNLKNYLF